MRKYRKKILAKLKEESGIALIFVLVLLVLGSATIIPVLAFLNDSLSSGRLYEEKTDQLYTADSGIEDGLWRIKYDYMGVGYDPFDYYGSWPYETDPVNGLTANVTIKNVWFPSDYSAPSAADARDIIESEKLIVVGTAGSSTSNPYTIKIDFLPDAGDNLTVKSLGVWLPQGYEYVADSCSLQDNGPFQVYYPDNVTIDTDAPGGTTILWSYNPSYPLFYEFPDVDSESRPMTLNFTFEYTPPAETPNKLPVAIAWITTGMTAGEYGTNPNDVPVSWDVDTRFYEILSSSGDTTIQAFSSKCELRQMGDAMSGDYVAIGGSLLADDDNDTYGQRETWHTPSSFTLDSIPEDADVIAAYLYWAGWRYEEAKTTLFSDSCNSIGTYWSYSSPTGWEGESGEYKSHDYGYGSSSRLLTMKNNMNLSAYTPGSIVVTWDYGSEVNAVLFGDSCNNYDDWDNGNAWTIDGGEFKGHYTASDYDTERYLTMDSGVVDLSGYSYGDVTLEWDMSEDGWLDNGDRLYVSYSSNNGSSWSSWDQVVRDDFSSRHESVVIPGTYLTNGFRVRFWVYGYSDYWDNIYLDDIEITGTGSLDLSDGLDFAFSGDGGSTWSVDYECFRGDQGGFMDEFLYIVPNEYVTSGFRMRFEVVGCQDTGEKIRIDNINIINLPIDTEVTFKIDGQQVYFDGSNPAIGPNPVVAGRSYVMLNNLGGPYGFSYACVRDVSALVKEYVSEGEEGHYPGNATYTVDGIEANNGRYSWSVGDSHFAHAGWSLIVVYASPETAGHYIYIRDDNFAFHAADVPGESLDFDEDGNPGGDITNFVVPEPITDQFGTVIETVAAKLTCFITEGDDFPFYMTDSSSIEITGEQSGLTKSLTNPECDVNDVWNGRSYPGTYEEGVDIDTFELNWSDNILTPGDSVLHVDMYTDGDAWNLVYFIISVRSETVTGGTSHYVIYG